MNYKTSRLKLVLLTTIIAALVVIPAVTAQDYSLEAKLPVNEKVRIGKLENGLTYYIQENKKPENRIEMRLALNAGSLQETDKQQGLAHLLEHMAFNGTKHFEKNDLIKFLESIGVKFGADLNAYTSFDETVYMLTIPSDSADLVDKGFMVMSDWAFNLTLDGEEIDKERGVVIEEWRLGQGPQQRMQDKYLPVLFKDSRYAERLPIGKVDVIENCEYDEIRNFYNDWYRPNLMALIVVGDMDVDLAEQKVIKFFKEHDNPKKAPERIEYDIPDHEGTLVSVVTDKEAPYTMIQLVNKADVIANENGADYLEMVKTQCIAGMLNRRFQELSEQADPPFIGAGSYYGGLYSRSKNAFNAYAAVGENGIERGVETLLEATNRIAQYGFTQGELDRYKLDLLKRYEQSYIERDKTESASLAGEYIRNFLEDESIPGIEFEYNFIKTNIDLITLEGVNSIASNLLTGDNRVIIATGPDKGSLATFSEEKLLALASEIDNKKIEPYVDKLASADLMKALPVAGSIEKESAIEAIDATELVLSNGAKVILKETDFKNDEILLTGFAWGGSSLVSEEDHFSALHADGIVSESGVSDFSRSDLTKLLAGKSAYVANSIGTYSENVSANCRPTDLETMLQLLYLNFTSPRSDEDAFQSYMTKYQNYFQNLAQDPDNYFYDKVNRIKAQNHPRGNYLPVEGDWEKVNFERVIDIYKDLYSNATEFTFVIVGAFDTDSIKPLIELYLGSLPSTSEKRTYKDLGIRPPKGKISENIYKGTEPKSRAIIYYSKEADYDSKDAFLFNQLGKHLTRRYTEVLREEMSGVYGVGARAGLSKVPYEHATMSITIPCSPENVDSLVAAAIREIKVVQKDGVEQDYINKLKEIYRREKESNLEENKWWLGAIKRTCTLDGEFDKITSFEASDDITSEALKEIANKFINVDEYLEIVHYPETMQEE